MSGYAFSTFYLDHAHISLRYFEGKKGTKKTWRVNL